MNFYSYVAVDPHNFCPLMIIRAEGVDKNLAELTLEAMHDLHHESFKGGAFYHGVPVNTITEFYQAIADKMTSEGYEISKDEVHVLVTKGANDYVKKLL